MAQNIPTPPTRSRWNSWWRLIGERILLIPEAVGIAGLMLASTQLSQEGVLALAVGFLTGWMALRIGLLYLTQRLLELERFTEAERCGRIAYLMYPWSADALALRGVVALSMGAYDDAVVFLRRALALYPHAAATQTALSGALLMLGRLAAARMAAQAAIVLDPQRAVAYLYLAEIEQIEGRGALEVEDTLRHGIATAQSADDQAALRCALAGLLVSQGRAAETALVLAGIEPLIAACPPAAQRRLRMRYGELLIAQGHLDRAREYLAQTDTHAQANRRRNAAWEAG